MDPYFIIRRFNDLQRNLLPLPYAVLARRIMEEGGLVYTIRHIDFYGIDLKVTELESQDVCTFYFPSGRVRLLYRWGHHSSHNNERVLWLKEPTPEQEMVFRIQCPSD
jgi:hypothetical protein